jgi:diguanylate cyclase (GGDEF)-like protein
MFHPLSRGGGFFRRLSVNCSAIASRPDARWALLFAGLAIIASLVVAYVDTHSELRYQWHGRTTIADLRELPGGQVKLRGVVTYVDGVNRRFWLQDETGAIAVNQDPRLTDTRPGDAVQVQMRKTHPYDPAAGLPSIGSVDFRVRRSRRNAPLPLPAKLTIPNLSQHADAGIRVTVEGVVHGASAKGNDLVQVVLGDQGQEVQAFVPGDPHHFAQLLNVRVRITGVLDVLQDVGWSPTSELIWVQNATDVERISGAQAATAVATIRSLYSDGKQISAHLVRLRGRVLYQETPQLVIVEDEWGAISCGLEQPSTFAPGTPIEVLGFIKRNGLRIDLVHTAMTTLPADGWQALSASRQLTSIASVRALSEETIRTAPPVKIAGVITYSDSDLRQLFLQDSTAGIFLKYAGSPVALHQGEMITVTGLANDGDFAPVIVAPKFTPMGAARLPKPVPMNMQTKYGLLDSLYGQVEGVVHPSREEQYPKHTTFYLHTALGPVHVDVAQNGTPSNFMANLQDATVRARGVVGEIFNSRKQLIGLQLTISNLKDIEVIEPGSSNPFEKSPTRISNLLKYSPGSRPDHRVVVSGTVTMLGNGFFYIQDQTGGVRIEGDTSGLHLRDAVDAAGYASPTGYSPALTDAVVKARPQSSVVNPQLVTTDMMSEGHLDSQLVSIEATFLGVENSTGARTLSVTSGGHTFQAVLYLKDTGQPFISPQVGSLLRLTGICSVEVDRGNTGNLLKKDPVAFKLNIGSPADIQVLEGGTWRTFLHSPMLVGILILAVILSAGRIVMLLLRIESKNKELRAANEKDDAIRQLIGAMHEVRLKKQFTSRVSVPEADELALLGTEFNHMIEELHVRDIGMAEAEAKLRQQALSDVLTGLPNRRRLSDRLSHSVAIAKRNGSLVAMLYIDLDGFKLVNDSFGHNFGDMLLIRVAERLSKRIRESDTLSRLGGDEFAVVMVGIKTVEHAELLAQTLLQVIASPFEIDGQTIRIGASIGICLFPNQANDESELLQFADTAMYSAKRSGKNRIVLFTKDLGESVRERLTIENQLRCALENGEISVHYQPEFEIGSTYPIRFEALARWTHPTLGNIPPLKFIPIAEESGLIVPLGAYIMERACADCMSWQSKGGTPIEVAVNVSTVQFSRDSFVDEVETTLKKTGLNPRLLQLEVTESVMLGGLQGSIATIKRLQSIGVTVAIDDFGTGYSALSYIEKLPFNALKIDRSFVREIVQRSETKAMVRSLILFAQELGMKVIVEGIESEAQLRAIQEIGADEAQGYFLGRPTANPLARLSSPDGIVQNVMNDLVAIEQI